MWYVLWHRYLNDNPEKWGARITQAELLQLTSGEAQLNFDDSSQVKRRVDYQNQTESMEICDKIDREGGT